MGSSTYLTDNFGRPSHYYETLPFGEMIVEHNQSSYYDNKYKFNGKELDEATQMYYYGARYYDPRISIFVSVDPLAEEFVGWTPYHYVHQNPINLIDPTGMSADGWIEQEKDGKTTVTHDWRVNTKEEAIAAGYQNVTQVHESGTVDGFYNLNTDGTVCATDGSCIDWQRSGSQIMSSFVTESQTEIQTDEFNTYQAATGPSVFSPAPGSGRITSIGGIGDIFGFKEMLFGEVATATNNPYAGVILGVASKGKSSTSLGVHGNSLKSMRPTWGYKLYSNDGTFLKNGITSQAKAESRYTKSFMSDKYMEKQLFQNRRAAYDWEAVQNRIKRGPLNKNNH